MEKDHKTWKETCVCTELSVKSPRTNVAPLTGSMPKRSHATTCTHHVHGKKRKNKKTKKREGGFWRKHVMHNEWTHTFTKRVKEDCEICHIWVSHVTYSNESRHTDRMSTITHAWVVSDRIYESCHVPVSHATHEWVMSHTSESCQTYKWVTTHRLHE